MEKTFKEQLYALCHESWCKLVKDIFKNCVKDLSTGEVIVPDWAVKRWQQQCKTAYADLSDHKKEYSKAIAKPLMKAFERELKNRKIPERRNV